MANTDIDIRQLLPQGALLQNGKYKVVRYLSSGNFGNTYIVENTGMQVQFAMKEFFLRNICYRTGGQAISVSPAVDPDKVEVQREKFKKEARRLYGLTSKHLVHVNDMFEENGTVYYVMDFVKGESLAHYIERQHKPLTEEQTLYIFDQLMEGIEEIHQKQIWHLDLKPDNVMIDKDGNVVIVDFGASKQVGRSGKYTGTSGILCYTPGYAPLEQVNQNLEAVGPWTDIYALGATLYNLLTGIEPSTVNPSLLQFPSNVSAKTQQVIRCMMNTDMKQRPQSIAELRQLVAATPAAPAANKPSAASAVGADSSSPKSSSISNRRLMFIVAFIIVVVLGIIILSTSGGNTEEQRSDVYKKQEQVDEKTGATSLPKAEPKEEVRIDSIFGDFGLGRGLYVGPVENYKPHGWGKMTFDDGRRYSGPFVHGVMEGDNAVFYYANGDKFEGTFKNDAFYQGRYTIKDTGDYFIGLFSNGQPDDKNGQWYDKNGNKY